MVWDLINKLEHLYITESHPWKEENCLQNYCKNHHLKVPLFRPLLIIKTKEKLLNVFSKYLWLQIKRLKTISDFVANFNEHLLLCVLHIFVSVWCNDINLIFIADLPSHNENMIYNCFSEQIFYVNVGVLSICLVWPVFLKQEWWFQRKEAIQKIVRLTSKQGLVVL